MKTQIKYAREKENSGVKPSQILQKVNTQLRSCPAQNKAENKYLDVQIQDRIKPNGAEKWDTWAAAN